MGKMCRGNSSYIYIIIFIVVAAVFMFLVVHKYKQISKHITNYSFFCFLCISHYVYTNNSIFTRRGITAAGWHGDGTARRRRVILLLQEALNAGRVNISILLTIRQMFHAWTYIRISIQGEF